MKRSTKETIETIVAVLALGTLVIMALKVFDIIP